MIDFKRKEQPLTIRERLAFTLTIFLIQMIHPFEYSHQYKKFWEELKEIMHPPKIIHKEKTNDNQRTIKKGNQKS